MYKTSDKGTDIFFIFGRAMNVSTTTYQHFFYLERQPLEKRATEQKKRCNYYPFGLKQKGYNSVVTSSGNSTAQKFKFNGIEYEESLGLNLYEMDVRSYDPAIARWTSMDPVIHFNYSPYQAFDNNPIFFADPRGANSEAPSVTLQQLFDMSPNGTTWVNNGNGTFSVANNEQETDPRKVLKESIKNAKKAKKTIGKFEKVYNSLDGLYSIGESATPQERTKALQKVYKSITSFLPRNLSFKVFAQYYDTYLAMINYQMGIIIKGLQERNKIFADIGRQGNIDIGVIYPGAYYGGRELYEYLKVLKHGGKEIPALPNQGLKFLREFAKLLSFATDNEVPYSLTALDSTQFWVLKKFGKSRINIIRGEATLYIQNNLDSIINIIYGGLKIHKD